MQRHGLYSEYAYCWSCASVNASTLVDGDIWLSCVYGWLKVSNSRSSSSSQMSPLAGTPPCMLCESLSIRHLPCIGVRVSWDHPQQWLSIYFSGYGRIDGRYGGTVGFDRIRRCELFWRKAPCFVCGTSPRRYPRFMAMTRLFRHPGLDDITWSYVT